MRTIVKIIFAATTKAYAELQAALKSKRAQAFAVPLTTTAIAAHKARTLNLGTAIARSFGSRIARVNTPPTHSESAVTCITKEPIASA